MEKVMKILVIEDNVKILNSICDELNTHFETYKCSDGEEALYQLIQYIYDLIIFDLMLRLMKHYILLLLSFQQLLLR